MSVFDLAASMPWAIRADSLRTILEIASRENPSLEVVEAQLGRRLESTRTVSIRDGVAIVPVVGPMFRYANLFTAISGGSSGEILAKDFATAIADPNVKAILLSINSPGGQVDGTSELAQAIFAARGVKPIWAHVDGDMASGAYWVGSAASRIVASDTSLIGSIGVVMGYTDTRDADAKAGVKRVEIVSSRAPGKRLDPATDAGREKLLARIDGVEAIFLAAVAKHRGVSIEKVVSDFGQGDVLLAGAAVAAGMADAVGSFEATLAELASKASPSARPNSQPLGVSAMDPNATIAVSAINLAYLVANHAALVGEIRSAAATAATTAGAEAERARILAIQAHGKAAPGHEKLVAELIADGSVTADAAAGRILAAVSAARAGQLDALKDDKGPAPSAPPVVAPPAVVDDKSKPLEERAKAAWDKDADLRAEFGGNFAAYVGFVRADESGLVRRVAPKAAA